MARTVISTVGAFVQGVADQLNAMLAELYANSGIPGGSDTQVQFNDDGAFSGDSGLTWDTATKTLTVQDTGQYVNELQPSAPRFYETDGFGPALTLAEAGGGTRDNPTASGTADFLGQIDFAGTTSNNHFSTSTALIALVDGVVGPTYVKGLLEVRVSDGTNAPAVVLSMNSAGIKATGYKSSDGSSGVTAGPFTVITAITVKNGLVTAITGS